MDQKVERQPVAAYLPDRPDEADHAGAQDRDGHGDPHQDPGIMPRETVFVDLTEIDDLDAR